MDYSATIDELREYSYNKAHIHFIYIFLLENIDTSTLKSVDGSQIRNILRVENKECVHFLSNSKAKIELYWHNPKERMYFSVPAISQAIAFLHIKKNEGPVDEKLSMLKNIYSKGEWDVKIFENGIGVIRFTEHIEQEAPMVDILNYLRQPEFAESLYYQNYKNLVGNLTKLINNKNNGKDIVWIDKPDTVDHILKGNTFTLTFESEEDGINYQNPYAFVEFELEKDKFNEWFSKPMQNPEFKQYSHLINLILRLIGRPSLNESLDISLAGRVEIIECLNNNSYRLCNLSTNSKFFLNCGNKSCLCAFPEGSYNDLLDQRPEREERELVILDKITLEIVEAFRIRWYINCIIGGLLDKKIQEFGRILNEISEESKEKSKYNVFEKLKDLVKEKFGLKEMVLKLTEDFFVEKLSSGGVTELYRAMAKRLDFEIDERRITNKLNMIDRLYDDIIEYVRLDRLGEIDKSN